MPLAAAATAATAVAALVQLRHLRSSNQIAAITRMLERLDSETFTRAKRFVAEHVPKLIADPVGRSPFARRCSRR